MTKQEKITYALFHDFNDEVGDAIVECYERFEHTQVDPTYLMMQALLWQTIELAMIEHNDDKAASLEVISAMVNEIMTAPEAEV